MKKTKNDPKTKGAETLSFLLAFFVLQWSKTIGKEETPCSKIHRFAQPFLPQLERNLRWLEGECAKLRGYQEQLNTKCIEKNDR